MRENLHRSPLYGLDLIRGIGPRYCPSIEDKVVKFAHNPTHQIFVEPEGWDEPTFYVGGFSTSLPADVQLAMLRTLPGFDERRHAAPGYAVEYDFVQPTELDPSLETRRVAGLFHCGQLNGTSGYEEAAAQGLIAGINAARRARGREPLRLGRETLLHRRPDRRPRDPRRRRAVPHADLARRAPRRAAPRQRRPAPDPPRPRARPGRRRRLGRPSPPAATRSPPPARGAERTRLGAAPSAGVSLLPGATLADALRRPDVDGRRRRRTASRPARTRRSPPGSRSSSRWRATSAASRPRSTAPPRDEAVGSPADLDYAAIRALSHEAREKLDRTRPRTLGAAARIPGISPTDLALVSIHVHRQRTATPA